MGSFWQAVRSVVLVLVCTPVPWLGAETLSLSPVRDATYDLGDFAVPGFMPARHERAYATFSIPAGTPQITGATFTLPLAASPPPPPAGEYPYTLSLFLAVPNQAENYYALDPSRFVGSGTGMAEVGFGAETNILHVTLNDLFIETVNADIRGSGNSPAPVTLIGTNTDAEVPFAALELGRQHPERLILDTTPPLPLPPSFWAGLVLVATAGAWGWRCNSHTRAARSITLPLEFY